MIDFLIKKALIKLTVIRKVQRKQPNLNQISKNDQVQLQVKT